MGVTNDQLGDTYRTIASQDRPAGSSHWTEQPACRSGCQPELPGNAPEQPGAGAEAGIPGQGVRAKPGRCLAHHLAEREVAGGLRQAGEADARVTGLDSKAYYSPSAHTG